MKKFKVIPAIVFVLLTLTYLIIYSGNQEESKVELPIHNFNTYLSLDENDQIKIIGLAQDSVTMVTDFSKEGKEFYTNIPNDEYKEYQRISTNVADAAEKTYFVKRLILLGFILITIMIAFKGKLKYNVTFQKALFENVKTSIVFVLFSIAALLITQSILGTLRSPSQMLQILFGEAISTLKYALLYSVFIAVFIYFHPQNIHWYNKRLEKKRKRAEAENK